MKFQIGDIVKLAYKTEKDIGKVAGCYSNKVVVRWDDLSYDLTYSEDLIELVKSKDHEMQFKVGDHVKTVGFEHTGVVVDITTTDQGIPRYEVKHDNDATLIYYGEHLLRKNPESNKKQSDTVVTLDDHRKVTTKEVVTKTTVEEKSEYPKLMKYKYGKDSFIVLFRDHGCGIVVNSSHPTYKVGDYDVDWIMEHFKDHDEEITLKNK
jgi:hypothetical protein